MTAAAAAAAASVTNGTDAVNSSGTYDNFDDSGSEAVTPDMDCQILFVKLKEVC
jgi:hypothetical protein